MARVTTKLADRPKTASIPEMMRELDEIAQARGIVWGPQELAGCTVPTEPTRTKGTGGSAPSVPFNGRKRPADRGSLPNPPTEKMVNYIALLWGQCMQGSPVDLDKVRAMTFEQAHTLIEHLKQAKATIQRTAPTQAPAPLTTPTLTPDTLYIVDRDVYKVVESKNGRLYAKKLVVYSYGSCSYEYEAGAITRIRPEHVMSYEQALQFGERFGVCCQCARKLTNEQSITASIGPVCRRKFG